jgi:hypothetical protein
MNADRFATAEAALVQAAAVVALRKQGTSRAATARALGLTDRQVWKVEYALGLSDNSNDAAELQRIHPRSLRLADPP